MILAIKLFFIWVLFVSILFKVLHPPNRRCPKCGYQSTYNSYCAYDGSKMIKAKRIVLRCKQCNKEIWRSDTYCGNCGEKT